MRKILPLMTILTQSRPSSHLQAGLGKAVSWMFEVFSEHIRVWGFSELGDDSPFFFGWSQGKRKFVDLPLCPTAVVGQRRGSGRLARVPCKSRSLTLMNCAAPGCCEGLLSAPQHL